MSDLIDPRPTARIFWAFYTRLKMPVSLEPTLDAFVAWETRTATVPEWDVSFLDPSSGYKRRFSDWDALHHVLKYAHNYSVWLHTHPSIFDAFFTAMRQSPGTLDKKLCSLGKMEEFKDAVAHGYTHISEEYTKAQRLESQKGNKDVMKALHEDLILSRTAVASEQAGDAKRARLSAMIASIVSRYV